MNEFDVMLLIEKHKEELKEREESSRAAERLLDLVTQLSDFVLEYTSEGFTGLCH